MKVGAVVIDCNDFHAMFTFWREALRHVPRDEPEEDWVFLRDPEGRGVNVSLQNVPEPRVGKNRLHLDLDTKDQAGEVERARTRRTLHPRTPEAGDDFVSLLDPEGNVFDVIHKPDEG